MSTLLEYVTCCLLSAGAAMLFDPNRLDGTFSTLEGRQCLPADFDSSSTATEAGACGALAASGQVPPECAEATALALFYNCVGRG